MEIDVKELQSQLKKSEGDQVKLRKETELRVTAIEREKECTFKNQSDEIQQLKELNEALRKNEVDSKAD